ncbi:MAG: hypothetical protein CMG25_01420, partial [Candidatus Marinimicrobia bacterium]|nr:hypothetical protein [Candidatus Neomarinimicrobiota bacterium]
MKIRYILLLLALFIMSCDETPTEQEEVILPGLVGSWISLDYYIQDGTEFPIGQRSKINFYEDNFFTILYSDPDDWTYFPNQQYGTFSYTESAYTLFYSGGSV